jgi:hypothetical protein
MNFNKDLFADLLQKAKGDRSINRFGSEADVDPGYISRLLRRQLETPPGATVLTKIAGSAANSVTIEQLLGAAGYINLPHLDIVVGNDNGRTAWSDLPARSPATGSATGTQGTEVSKGDEPYAGDHNPDVSDDSMVEELLSFCQEMMERPIVLEAFKRLKDLSDDKLRRALKMIKMIAEMGD